MLKSVGQPATGVYVAGMGFAGEKPHLRWRKAYGAELICPPRHSSKHSWPKPWRRWLAGLRQIVESVNARLQLDFGLERERPHELSGFQARLAAKATLHNFCIWRNQQLGRPNLAFADLIRW
jgi:hypothetical protein